MRLKIGRFLVYLILMVGCQPSESPPDFISLQGFVYDAHDVPVEGGVVEMVIHYCGGFGPCFSPDKKFYRARTDSNGFYDLHVDDGHLGKRRTIDFSFGGETSAHVGVVLDDYEMRVPDLREWRAEPEVSFADDTTTFINVRWTALPAHTDVPPEKEKWRAKVWTESLGGDPVEIVVWEGANGVSVPTKVFSDFDVSHFDVRAEHEFERNGKHFELSWGGGSVAKPALDALPPFDLLACWGKDSKSEEVRESTGVFSYIDIDVRWVACQFDDPVTVSAVAWYDADLEDEAGEEVELPQVDVFLASGKEVPTEVDWGAPVAGGDGAFGYQNTKPKVARWIILAPRNDSLHLEWIMRLRAW